MKTRYRLTRRGIRGDTFYCVDTMTGKRASLRKGAKLQRPKAEPGIDCRKTKALFRDRFGGNLIQVFSAVLSPNIVTSCEDSSGRKLQVTDYKSLGEGFPTD